MIMIDKIKEYIKCPQFGDLEYGEWGALRLEQREAYKHLIEIIEWQEHEISRLNGLIKEIECYSSEDVLEEEPRDIEVCGSLFTKSEYDKLAHNEEPKGIPEKIDEKEIEISMAIGEQICANKINEMLDYLESKGE